MKMSIPFAKCSIFKTERFLSYLKGNKSVCHVLKAWIPITSILWIQNLHLKRAEIYVYKTLLKNNCFSINLKKFVTHLHLNEIQIINNYYNKIYPLITASKLPSISLIYGSILKLLFKKIFIQNFLLSLVFSPN